LEEQLMAKFDVDDFVAECRAALAESKPQLAVKEVLERALSSSSAVADVLAREEGGLNPLHHAPDLTIANVVWVPNMSLYPHDHNMWAVIGIYAGAEDNHFYRRSDGTIVESGVKTVSAGDQLVMGDDVIHSVTNPLGKFSGAMHVYGGDFFGAKRHEWDPETLEERPWSAENTQRAFDEATAAYEARESSA
jgi:predicted metal-dependent enzyme (double-stranded beta helix superfamily)